MRKGGQPEELASRFRKFKPSFGVSLDVTTGTVDGEFGYFYEVLRSGNVFIQLCDRSFCPRIELFPQAFHLESYRNYASSVLFCWK